MLEAVGDNKVRINHLSLDSPLVILANQTLEVVAVGVTLHIARRPGRPTTSMRSRPGRRTLVKV